MRILLITLGGAMDKRLDNSPSPVRSYVRSHAYTKLEQYCAVRNQYAAFFEQDITPATLTFMPLGRKGSKQSTKAVTQRLCNALADNHKDYDRIIVTLPARETFWASRRIATDLISPACPIIFTGAEAPDKNKFAENRETNLMNAAFKIPYLFNGVYFTEGETFGAAIPALTDYHRLHRPRFIPRRGLMNNFSEPLASMD